MRYRVFGRLGWPVSEIGFGAWALGGSWGPQDDAESVAALHQALDLGCNFIDTALAYGNGRSERVIARVLRERSGVDRIYVATKIPPAPGAWPPGPRDLITERFPAAYLRAKVEESLRNLQTDCLDLLQLHTWTRAWNRDPSALETLRELQREVDANRNLLASFLNRSRETGEFERIDTSNTRIITVASPPRERTFPPRAAILLAIGFALGVMLGLALAIAFELLGHANAMRRMPRAAPDFRIV